MLLSWHVLLPTTQTDPHSSNPTLLIANYEGIGKPDVSWVLGHDVTSLVHPAVCS